MSQQSPQASRTLVEKVVYVLLFCISIILPLFIPKASAATFTVLNTDDTGAGSLREAINDANTTPGADEIVFDVAVTGEIELLSSLDDISESLTITGPAENLTVAHTVTTILFNVINTDTLLTINGLDFQRKQDQSGILFKMNSDTRLSLLDCEINGPLVMDLGNGVAEPNEGSVVHAIDADIVINNCTIDGHGARKKGGAIFLDSSDLEIQGSTLSNNLLGSNDLFGGGAIYSIVDSIGSVSTILIQDSEFIDNEADDTNSAIAFGGALHFQAESGSYDVKIINSNFNGNQATSLGGAVLVRGNSTEDSSVEIQGCSFMNNSSQSSGGAVAYTATGGRLSIIDSVFQANDSYSFGGAIHLSPKSEATVSITESVLMFNTAHVGGGLAVVPTTDAKTQLTISDSTISKNTAESTSSPGAGAGGLNFSAQANGELSFELINLTISENFSAGVGAISIYEVGPDAKVEGTILHNTIFMNESSDDTEVGGLDVDPDADVLVLNSIIAKNFNGVIPGPLEFDEVDAGGSFAAGYTLIGTVGNATITGQPDGTNLTPIADPKLASLEDVGGGLFLNQLLEGSPAVDMAAENPIGFNGDYPEFDQRGSGFPRIVNSVPDMGAFEAPAGFAASSSGGSSSSGGDASSGGSATSDSLSIQSADSTSSTQLEVTEEDLNDGGGSIGFFWFMMLGMLLLTRKRAFVSQ